MKKLFSFLFSFSIVVSLIAQEEKSPLNSGTFSGLSFRNVGPAITSGRVADLAVHPTMPSTYYVAAASGGVWKTTNAGTTYNPIFDGQGSYSIGCVSIDPHNTNSIWVGTGENNNQRSVAYGDGLYKSDDAGKTWKKIGLEKSEHIGMITFDPKTPGKVFVAAYGPLWSDGGDRGLYLSEDYGNTWKNVLDISKYTGVNEVHIHPENPNIVYATAHQRRRHVWTYISGGPESAIYKSIDGGKTFEKLTNGLPKGDVGRIALAIPKTNPDVVYATIEGEEKNGGFYKSTDRGASFARIGDHQTSGNYYVELYVDPNNENKIFSMDTYCQVSLDGGKTFKGLGEKNKHVDNHCMWINPNNSNHYLMGCDGGIYETFDDASAWAFKANLPITQFYKVAVDYDKPFYNIYGGTQDNFSLGGPSQNISANGIPNSDWFITNGGDGFESAIDPKDPNIVYAQSQYGWLVRYDKASGEKTDIKPFEAKGEAAYRWNWDAPLLISPHDNKTLYFSANKVFKSTDRGNSWKTISEDLSRGIDRNTLKVMDKVWSVDAVAKNKSTTIYGNIVSFDESAQKQGLLYAGTDDGLIHVTENDGESWKKIESFSGVPAKTYVNFIKASLHKENEVFAGFNNHKNGDFKPYLMMSTDKGTTWKSIAGDLPERGSVYCFAQDHVNPNLWFVGTEFGVFFSIDMGKKWIQLKGGLPTIAIRDMEIQKDENDLVLASFGRGFYVLDDYSPLRTVTENILNLEAHMFPIEDALAYIQSSPIGQSGKSFQGDAYYAAENPPFGATFSLYLKDKIKTKKDIRQEAEKKLIKDGADVKYPTFEELRAEDQEESPFILFTIKDTEGNVVRRIKGKNSAGIQRVTWDLRYSDLDPSSDKDRNKDDAFAFDQSGPLALPGDYTVMVQKSENGKLSTLVEKASFKVTSLGLNTLEEKDKALVLTFQQKVRDLNRAVSGANRVIGELDKKLELLKSAALGANSDLVILERINQQKMALAGIKIKMQGDRSLEKREFETPPSISSRIGVMGWYLYNSTSAPTQSQKDSYRAAGDEFKTVLSSLKTIDETINQIHQELEKAKAPYVPGVIPNWDY